VTLTQEEFTYGFVNTFTPEDAAAAYERYAVPETGQIFYEAGFANFRMSPPTEVDFSNGDRAPLLIVGAGRDHTVPASVAKANYKLYQKSTAVTEYKEYPERTHWTLNQDGWEEVAEFALDWAVRNATRRPSATTGLGVEAERRPDAAPRG
jgi:alpha-beta hydrolase superfamily lysophospholipase